MKEERKSFQKHEQTKKRKKLVLIKHLKRFEKLQQDELYTVGCKQGTLNTKYTAADL